MADFSYSV